MTRPIAYLYFALFPCLIFSRGLQSQNLQIKTYTARDGLPASYILSLREDRLGYLWVSAYNGLSRFDGKYFTNYGFSDGLPDLRVDALFMDSQLRFWAGTRRGIVEFKGNKFVGYPMSDSLPSHFVYNFVEHDDGTVSALTDVGVYTFNGMKWCKLSLYPGFENHRCNSVVDAKEGMYINYGDLLVLRRKDGSYTIIGDLNKSGSYYNSMSTCNGEIFVSTTKGLCVIKHEKMTALPGWLGALKGNYTYFQDRKKRFWVSSDSIGLRVSDSSDVNKSRLVYKHPLINLISGIREDSKSNIWIADYTGLVRISEAGFKLFESPALDLSKALRNIIQPPDCPLFINNGTLNEQIWDRGSFHSRKLNLVGKNKSGKEEFIIRSIAFDDHDRYWYNSWGFSLFMQQGADVHDQMGRLAHLGDQAFDVLFDRYRKKVIVAVRTQKYPCQFNDTGFSRMNITNDADISGNITHLFQCANGTILISTDKGLIYSIDLFGKCRLQLAEFNSTGIVRRFFTDLSGDLWIIYNGRGIRRYQWMGDSLVFNTKITKENGLHNDYVKDVCCDNKGNLWVATSNTLEVLSTGNEYGRDRPYSSIAFFSEADLQVEDYYDSKLTRDRDGNIWQIYAQKVACFYPSEVLHQFAVIPEVHIENIQLNLQPTDWSRFSDSLSGIFQLPVQPRMPYDKNTIGINFKGVSSSGTEEIQYSYLLEGLGDTWSGPSSNDFVSFVNLPAGIYTFKVKAKLPNSDWGKPEVFSFIIGKAFWETWWFRTFIILLASFAIVSVSRYRITQIRRKADYNTKLTDFENKALKSQMNPHFIFNAMNSIQSLIMNDDKQKAAGYISKFARLMRQVLENSEDNLVTIEKELASLRLYIDLERLRMNLEFQYIETIDPIIEIEKEKMPPLSLQPFVENAIWHGLSKKDGPKEISLKMTVRGNWIVCEITDNGVGRTYAKSDHNWLPEGHLSRATLITAQRLINYNQTTIPKAIDIIDLVDGNNSPLGTRVVIYLRREVNFR